ncbi:MAG TPA: hypothetical protein VG963_10935 [Polyangiaceae bacterium]|nr:hypothetical protein [Polyangiaceae bacterium]
MSGVRQAAVVVVAGAGVVVLAAMVAVVVPPGLRVAVAVGEAVAVSKELTGQRFAVVSGLGCEQLGSSTVEAGLRTGAVSRASGEAGDCSPGVVF